MNTGCVCLSLPSFNVLLHWPPNLFWLPMPKLVEPKRKIPSWILSFGGRTRGTRIKSECTLMTSCNRRTCQMDDLPLQASCVLSTAPLAHQISGQASSIRLHTAHGAWLDRSPALLHPVPWNGAHSGDVCTFHSATADGLAQTTCRLQTSQEVLFQIRCRAFYPCNPLQYATLAIPNVLSRIRVLLC